MPGNLHPFQVAPKFTAEIAAEWSSKLKELLEGKHLYQKVTASLSPIRANLKAPLIAGHEGVFDQFAMSWENRRLKPVMALTFENFGIGGQTAQVTSPVLVLSNVKLYCSGCESAEIFSPLWGRDVADECKGAHGRDMPRADSHQLFFLAFQCQRCHGDPEGFTVRRDGERLYLEGRSPMETVALPTYLPKKEIQFFSDAVVAYNAGKKLAALFYLRTFLEQFAKRITGRRGRVTGEELMDAYTATIPGHHRDHMPSFREWYEKLSEALHDAREDDALFESARAEIDRHFDIRRVYRITEPKETLTSEATVGPDSAVD